MESLSALSVTCTMQKAPPRSSFHSLISTLSSSFKPLSKEGKQVSLRVEVPEFIRSAPGRLLEAFAESAFKFVAKPLTDEGNFAPVDEIGEAVPLSIIEGEVPDGFPEGVYIRNGPNHLHPDQTAAVSMLGTTVFTWVEGDGMLHATYFNKDSQGKWRASYKNRYVEGDTFLMEKRRNKNLFIPAADGHPYAILAAFILNTMRFGKAVKDINNTNVFEHAGRVFSIAENHLPYEIDASNLDTLRRWDVDGAWDRSFTSHPKRAPGSGELVVMGADPKKPFYVLGVISADGKKMLHKVDLKFKEGILVHELGVTEKFVKFDKDGKSKIGVMPRFGDAESIAWFDVKNHCSFHIINSFENGNEIIVRGCRTVGSVVPGPDHTDDKSEWYRRAFTRPNEELESFDPDMDGILFSRPYEWRLNMRTGAVVEGYLTGKEVAMDFPAINNRFTGHKNKYAYTQVVDSVTSSEIGLPKFRALAKLYFDEQDQENSELIKVEYHVLDYEHYCSGVQFVEKGEGFDEDEGWVVCYVHDERENVSKVHIIDAKKFTEEPVAKMTLPQRVPYGFHGNFIRK